MSDLIRTYEIQEWISEGTRLFGAEVEDWKFVCPVCNHAQSYRDFERRTNLKGSSIYKILGFSCIGRFLKEQKDTIELIGGCNWTLKGMCSFHKAEVVNEDGSVEPIFEFARGGESGKNKIQETWRSRGFGEEEDKRLKEA